MNALAWPSADQLTIAFGPVPKGYPTQKSRLINAAINIAMAQINGLGSAVALRRVGYTEDPDIALRPSLFLENEAVHGEAGLPDGERIGAG